MFHEVLGQAESCNNNFGHILKFKILIKLSKIYTELFNHFKARECLKEARAILKNQPDLVSDKLLLRYRDAKCKYFMKLAIIPKFKKNIELLENFTS